jgi:hypothetical protein
MRGAQVIKTHEQAGDFKEWCARCWYRESRKAIEQLFRIAKRAAGRYTDAS